MWVSSESARRPSKRTKERTFSSLTKCYCPQNLEVLQSRQMSLDLRERDGLFRALTPPRSNPHGPHRRRHSALAQLANERFKSRGCDETAAE